MATNDSSKIQSLLEDPEIQDLLSSLQDKYHSDGENLSNYLEGLLNKKYIDYWSYINLNALLNLQHPETDYPDEMVFIIYHQMTELLFKLSIWELKQIANHQSLGSGFLKERIHRINNYFRVLTQSFSIMTEGLDPDQFLKFRMALVPASGFQSVQYRMLEIACTPLQNLVHQDHRERLKNASIEEQFAEIYWKRGAIVANTGEKTLTLKRFEDQYDDFLIKWAKDWQGTTLWERYQSMLEAEKDESMLKQMRTMDKYINIHWPKAHFQTAKRYLEHGSSDDEGTGGTNYKEYLPPRIQKRIFFPDLWTEEERANWGRT